MSLFPPSFIKTLLRKTTTLPFMRMSRWLFPVSCILMCVSIGLLFWPSLNYGIDFRGGILIEANLPKGHTVEEFRSLLEKSSTLEGGKIQEYALGHGLMFYQPLAPGDNAENVVMKARLELGRIMHNLDIQRIDVVGPTVSKELMRSGLIAIALVLLLLLLYLCFRFEWHFGLGAIFAIFHDVLLTLGIFVLLQWEIGLNIVAALLAVAGYSLNDTVIVYDRIRENLRKFRRKTMSDIIDISVNETLSRTALTSLTTLLAILILYIWGGDTLRGFTLAMLCGIIVGTYSSVFVASYVLPMLGMKQDMNSKAPKKDFDHTASPKT